MKVGEKYQDDYKTVVITSVDDGGCEYECVVETQKQEFYISANTFKDWIRRGVYTLVPDKSNNFTSLYDKLSNQ